MKIIPFESDETRKIRFTIIKLTQQLNEVEHEITEFHQAMYAFEREYQKRLGDIAEALLILRAELGMIEEDNKATPVVTYLADAEYHALKTAYRLAARLCHPDHLPPEHREQGLHLFDALNKSYHLQDLVTVEHILWLLQSKQAFSDNPVFINEAKLLIKQHELLGYLIEQKKDQLSQLKMQEEYDISNRDNWNILLYDYQTRLEDELSMLRGRANHMTKD